MDDHRSIVGVFRNHTQVNKAVEALNQAGIGEDRIQQAVYQFGTAEREASLSQQEIRTQRIVVSVNSDDKEGEIFNILFYNGANNTDLPPGTVLDHGSLIAAKAGTYDLIHEESPNESIFGEVTVPGHPDEISLMDNPNFPHG